MRYLIATGVSAGALLVSLSIAQAQTTTTPSGAPTASGVANETPTANPGPGNKAINHADTTNPGAPVQGANSFTESQARSRMEGMGFKITGLTKGADGVWRGNTVKDGRSQTVSLDFQGNVVAK